eukprot:638578-Rhodomonas_salina.1
MCWTRRTRAEVCAISYAHAALSDTELGIAELPGGEAVHKLYTNKVAVIAGDYLLARASVLLARLQNTEVRYHPRYWLRTARYRRRRRCRTMSATSYVMLGFTLPWHDRCELRSVRY